MERSVLNLRLGAMGAAFALVLLLFTVRLWSLQLAQWGAFADEAARNRTTVVYETAPRGLIVDRDGRVLADNQYIWNVHIVPKELPKSDPELDNEIAVLAGLLKTSAGELRERIEKIQKQSSLQAVPLEGPGQNLTLEQVVKIEERRSQLPGVIIAEKTERVYPEDTLAAHALGYARPIARGQYERFGQLIYPDDVFNGSY
ncbi:MAG: hypothetical protein ACLFWB_07150, partial [Armatimonadota bacterium]